MFRAVECQLYQPSSKIPSSKHSLLFKSNTKSIRLTRLPLTVSNIIFQAIVTRTERLKKKVSNSRNSHNRHCLTERKLGKVKRLTRADRFSCWTSDKGAGLRRKKYCRYVISGTISNTSLLLGNISSDFQTGRSESTNQEMDEFFKLSSTCLEIR